MTQTPDRGEHGTFDRTIKRAAQRLFSCLMLLLASTLIAVPSSASAIPTPHKPSTKIDSKHASDTAATEPVAEAPVVTPPPPPPPDPLGRSTPRGAVLGFLHAA